MIDVLVVDYGMGNLRSVVNALAAVGGDAVISNSPGALREARRVVLPGVGAFGDAMRNLRQEGWIEALERDVRAGGKPFLGLCLGMHLLATHGTESGTVDGLGWIPGAVGRLDTAGALRVPHIGWNEVTILRQDGLFAGLGGSRDFYFAHSFVLRPDDPSVASATCTYGETFAAAIESGNVHATQFHPEKSQSAGLAALRNFLACPD
jgi:imidazole glycerol-phosphate synthase subunit HisH